MLSTRGTYSRIEGVTQGFLQGTTTLKMHKSSIEHISHILRMAKILLHRVTTHKIHISTNEANFINSQIITISCFYITCLNSIPLYKRKMFSLLLLHFFCCKLNYLAQVSFSLGHSLAKCPASLQRKHITSDKSRGFLFGQLLR